MNKAIFLNIFLLLFLLPGFASAQTGVFTYQGKLIENGNPATANYDFECKLYDAATGGMLLGTRTRLNVAVTGGVFTITLDFGPTLFDGSDRYLEIGVRTGGSTGGYQQLLPRQPLSSAPYAFHSLIATNAINATTAQNALQLGGVPANQYVLTTDSRMSDARNPLPNSGNYVQNTTNQQTTSNFNISGNGTAGGTLSGNMVNAANQYNLAGQRVLTATTTGGGANLLVGINAGAANTGFSNTFVGKNAGQNNTSGAVNTLVGSDAGVSNTTGASNTFLGETAGSSNTTGFSNTFLGKSAGFDNKTGNSNTLVGVASGANTLGSNNTFIGTETGVANTTGNNNTTIGRDANVGQPNLTFATAIGSGAVVSNSNSVALGRADGSDTVRIPGPVIIDDTLIVHTLGGSGITQLCLNLAERLASCSSSLRYKSNVTTFLGGLNVVTRLRPIRFTWKEGGVQDVGFGAEEVNEIEPLLTTRNKQGEIEGVKYGQLTTVLVNAVKEQQSQIETQQTQIQNQDRRIEELQRQIAGLTVSICQSNPQAEVCKRK